MNKPYCAMCEKRVDKTCHFSEPSYKWNGVDIIACENMPEGKIAKFDIRVPPEPCFAPKVTLKCKAEICENCYYCRNGICYERPPVLHPKTLALWRPRVEPDDFCGQFTEKK